MWMWCFLPITHHCTLMQVLVIVIVIVILTIIIRFAKNVYSKSATVWSQMLEVSVAHTSFNERTIFIKLVWLIVYHSIYACIRKFSYVSTFHIILWFLKFMYHHYIDGMTFFAQIVRYWKYCQYFSFQWLFDSIFQYWTVIMNLQHLLEKRRFIVKWWKKLFV